MIQVLDNFYKNPKAIQNLYQNSQSNRGCGGSIRSTELQYLNPIEYSKFRDKVYNIHNIKNVDDVKLTTFFMNHEYSMKDPIFNKRWVHIDGKDPSVCRMLVEEYKLLFCGQIFLSEDADISSGVSFHKLKDNVTWSKQELYDKTTINEYSIPIEKYKSGVISLDVYKKLHIEYHDNFNQIQYVENVYNRLVSWEAGSLHADSITDKMKNKLCQYYFIEYK